MLDYQVHDFVWSVVIQLWGTVLLVVLISIGRDIVNPI
jgi:hypothetical protein